MVAQTTMNSTTIKGAPGSNGAAARATHSATALLRDVWTLAELQCKLVAADFQESRRRAVAAVVAIVIGLTILLAGMPIALIALAKLLVTAGLSEPAAYGCAALAALVVAAGVLWFGWRRLNTALATFARSRDELGRNLSAIQCLMSSCDEPAARV